MELAIVVVIIIFVIAVYPHFSIGKEDVLRIEKTNLDLRNKEFFKTKHTKTLESEMLLIKDEYTRVIDVAYKRFLEKAKNINTNQNAIFLGFDTVFTIEEYSVISKYETMHNIINSRVRENQQTLSYYEIVTRRLYRIFDIDID